MNSDNLHSETEHVVLMVPKEELRDIVRSVVSEFLADREDQKKEVLLTRQAVTERLQKDPSTLWRWEKTNYLTPVRVGKSVYYRESDVQKIEEGRI